MTKYVRPILNIVSLAILVFFVASFFIGLKTNPGFISDVAASPYGLFSYFLVTVFTAFIPSLATLPIVTTATFIWGPWIAGLTAIIGWTIGSIIEYYVALSAVNSLSGFLSNERTAKIGRKMKIVTGAMNLWQLFVARLLVPPFIFGMLKISPTRFIIISILTYIPLAIGGVIGGQLLKDQLEQIQPLIIGGAFILLIFTLDFIFVDKEEKQIEKLKS